MTSVTQIAANEVALGGAANRLTNIMLGDRSLRASKGNEILESSLWKDLDLIVDINYRMDTTALYSDVVLPAASYYENVDINSTDCHSYIHPFGKACEPLFESKTDWDIFHALADKMSQVAAAKGLKPYHDAAFDWNRDFTQLAHDWTGKGTIQSDEDAVNFILANAEETKGMNYKLLQEQGVSKLPQEFDSFLQDLSGNIAAQFQCVCGFLGGVEDPQDNLVFLAENLCGSMHWLRPSNMKMTHSRAGAALRPMTLSRAMNTGWKTESRQA